MTEFILSWTEWVGFVSALIYLYFSVNQKIWLWPMGILSSVFYMVVFFDVQLYADMVLQVYYLVVSIAGWIMWRHKQVEESKEKTKIRVVNKALLINLSASFIVLYVILAFLLIKIPPILNLASSDMPYWDAFTTAASFVATWMLAKKMMEQWLVWIVIDLVAMGMYIYKGLHITALLFFIYSVIAVWGYLSWLKDYKFQKTVLNTVK